MKTRKILALVLSLVMVLGLCGTAFAAPHATDEVTELETANSDLSMSLAMEGYALLENNGILPLDDCATKIALYGNAIAYTVKGGTGSGAVNNRLNKYGVNGDNIADAFVDAGWTVTNPEYVDAVRLNNGARRTGVVAAAAITDEQIAEGLAADTAIYAIARNAGEGSDRSANNATNGYNLTDVELENIRKVCDAYENVIIVYNTCVMDAGWQEDYDNIDAVVYMSNGGQRGSEALIKLLTGEANFSGKLTDTWPKSYEDYPSTPGFANNDGNNMTEYYTEGIYVGYRYFDTFGYDVCYPFGYGLSYTSFDIAVKDVAVADGEVVVTARVANTGAKYSGKEVVEVYFSAPDGELEKPYQELAAYGKTDLLAPGEAQTLTIKFDLADMGSYSMEKAAYIMEAGDYIIRVGNSSRNTKAAAKIVLDETAVTEQLSNQKVKEENAVLNEISKRGATPIANNDKAELKGAPVINLTAADIPYENNASPYDDETITTYLLAEDAANYKARESITLRTNTVNGIINNAQNPDGPQFRGYSETTYKEVVKVVDPLPAGITKEGAKLTDVYEGKITMDQFLACLSSDECARIAVGGAGTMEPAYAEDGNEIGGSSTYAQGGAGQTTQAYYLTRHIPVMPNADGPAGIRITQHYWINADTGTRYTSIYYNEAGQPCTRSGNARTGYVYTPIEGELIDQYQFCTAFPAGTCMAMTWDKDLVYAEGRAIGSEMYEYGVTTWLAPGINIHRNPLCGRNFEYYSEDPYLTGMTAASVTAGVQSNPGVGVTLKHFFGNSQETQRNSENNVMSERTAREIYLKGFEIAVKLAQPMCIMNCYNCNNGWPGSDDWDLNEDITRGEWGFQGAIMTDWGGGQSTPLISMHGGCDMIMSGGDSRMNGVRNAVGFVEPTFNPDGSIKNAGSFIPQADGSLTYVTPTDAPSENDLVESVTAAIAARTAKYDKIGDDAIIYWYGESAVNRICLGDVQKAARRVLDNALVSKDMAALYADLLDKEIEVPSISEVREAPLATGYKPVEKSTVKNIGIVAATVTVDTMHETSAKVDVTYTGEDPLTSVLLYVTSALPIESITSDNEFEYNPADGRIVVYSAYGTDISRNLFTINYAIDSLVPDGVYPVELKLKDATDSDAVQVDVVTVNGAIIVDNVFANGDVTLDGELDNRDLIMIARYLVGLVKFNAKQKKLADFDEDGDIDNVDLILIARAIVEEFGTPYKNEARGTYAYEVNGYDWGGAVTKIILDVTKQIDADSIDPEDFKVVNTSQGFCGTSTTTRTVTNAYASDAAGKRVEGASRYIAIEMYVDPNTGGAFFYNFMGSSHNEWPNPYTNMITFTEGATVTCNGQVIDTLTININATDIISPLSDQFEQHYFTSGEGIDLAYGSWAPAADNGKNPLIIWLHGAGEGGTDNRVVTMGNKVENLITEDIQKYFKTADLSGAYVLTPQSPDMWMNDGSGNYTSDGTSMYTAALMELIQSYVAATPDIDTNRIYIGGCSNGGYMTMNMLFNYPTYFAAAYPVCEAYTDSWITDAQIETIKNIPIWFTQAKNDGTVNPEAHTVATYARLQAAGAKDVYFSFFDDVHDTTGNYKNNEGEPYQYNGHWSWVYTLNNECVKPDGTTIMQWMAAQSK